jgi:alpha-L-rhamnosidase
MHTHKSLSQKESVPLKWHLEITLNINKMTKSKIILLICGLFALLGSNTAWAAAKVADLRCRSMQNPVGIDAPDFSWKLVDSSVGAKQSAYEIEVASSLKLLSGGKADMWRSGRVTSDEQLHIALPQNVKLGEAKRYWWRVRVADGHGQLSSWSQPANFVTGLTSWLNDKAESGACKWIAADWNSCKAAPNLRRVVSLPSKPVSAVVCVSTLGCGDLWLNGKLVDPTRVLDPAQTNYEQYAFYTTYDVTKLLNAGANCFGITLGNGWYNQDMVWGGIGIYGHPKARFVMRYELADGTKGILTSDDKWTWAESAVTMNNIYAGESYDARKEQTGWSTVAFDAQGWKPVQVTEENLPPRLVPQMMAPIRQLKAVKPVKTWRSPKGTWIIDFGINMAAVPRIKVNLPSGTTLKMCMAEYSIADTLNYWTTGPIATGHIQTDTYTCRGNGVETWAPRFTYHGFRYIELSGIDKLPGGDWIEAVRVNTDVKAIGDFSCDNAMINRLHAMAVNTFLSNTHGLPTDCPHRERCGWLGDAHAVAPFESINCDMENFFEKYMGDVNSSANFEVKNTLFHKRYNSEFYFMDKPVGLSYMIAPGRRQCGVASPDWGTAQVFIPWSLYWQYGNKQVLKDSYPYMKAWVKHIEDISNGNIVPTGLGDWCAPTGPREKECPYKLSSTAFHYRDVCEMQQIATILGHNDDAAHFASLKNAIAKAFVDTFYNAADKTFGTHTANAMALDLGLVPAGDELAVAKAIVDLSSKEYGGFLHVGIFGLGNIGQALARNGHAADAVRYFTKKGENSFEYMWTKGDATTTWETLPIDDANYNLVLVKAKSSLSHPMQSVYDQWFYEDIAGLRCGAPGWKKVIFAPVYDTDIHSAKASIDTPRGVASSSWKTSGGVMEWDVVVPANATGMVFVPSGKRLTVKGIATKQNGWVELPAGKWHLTVKDGESAFVCR